MREIKFKAWDKTYKKWLPDDGHMRMNGSVSWERWRWMTGEVELCQYTGLKDKNGNEIYEGDIIKIECIQFRNYYVEYVDNWARFAMNADSAMERESFVDYVDKNYNKLEVIGNIYENPELLEPK